MKNDLIILLLTVIAQIIFEYWWYNKNRVKFGITINELYRTIASLLIFSLTYALLLIFCLKVI